jgi:hypothetical protein
MTENEQIPPIPGPDGSEPSNTQLFVKRLFDEHPPGKFHEILKTGYIGLDGGDLILAKACSDHILSRAENGSGDIMRAMLLQAQIYERTGKPYRSNDLTNAYPGAFLMKTITELTRRTDALESTSPTADQNVTIEKHGDLELVRWGKLIVKMIRGISFSDL